MKVVHQKIKGERKKFKKTVVSLQKFKKKVVHEQLKKLKLNITKRISIETFKKKTTILNAKFAAGEITRSQWNEYTIMLKSWKTITR